jgi:Resolvase, N terminal domain
MERPALKQLLADIEEGLVDVAVVYKVDRLTRSLILREMRKLRACSGDAHAHGACFAHLLEQSLKRLHVAPKPGKGEAEPSWDFVVSACRFAFRGILTGVFDLPIDD